MNIFRFLVYRKGQKVIFEFSVKVGVNQRYMEKNVWIITLIYVAFAMMSLSACRNSVEADNDESTTCLLSSGNSKAKSSSSVKSSSKKSYPDSFKPNDKEYPYANIPRIVIYTENKQKIKDRETEIPAKLQIWGKKEAESEILDLTIRGRGNTSWEEMPKKSYKIEFEKKQSMLDMPKDKDWALIANYADKTLMRNYIAYRLSAALGVYYAPRCEFAELYLNDEYLGVYLLTETIKIAKNRVNIPENDFSYIVEADRKYKGNEQVVFSDILVPSENKKAFRVHAPKNASRATLDTVQRHIQTFETFLKNVKENEDNHVDDWIDVDESIKYYWVEEIPKNPDAGIKEGFFTSVYFTWVNGKKIKMGPVWDFDLAFGNYSWQPVNEISGWHNRVYWYEYLFKDSLYRKKSYDFWKEQCSVIDEILNEIDLYKDKLKISAKNNFNRWDVLNSDEHFWHVKAYNSYDDAVDDLKSWIENRKEWINQNVY